MAKELTDIIKAAAVVRDETAMQQNTATRVGGVLTDLAQFVGEAVFAAGMTAKTSAAGVSLLIKYYDADGQPYTKELPLPVASLLRAGVLTPAQLADLNTADRNETTARQASDAELLRRIQGKSTSSSAYSDPCINIGAFDHLYAEDGTTIIKRATIVVQETLEAQLQGTMQEVMKYIGKMRGLIYGIPFEAWNFVHRWPNAQQSSIYVQVLHSNFPANAAGELAGQDSHLHTLCRTVNVYLDADGNFDHSEVSPWRECSLQEADRNNLAAFAYLGAFASMDAAGAKAATIPYAGNADFVLLRFRIGDKGGLILQNVNGASTEQYLFYNGKRYVRYVDFTSADRTAVKTVQAWKLDGVAYIFYDAANRIIYQRNQWDENISGGGPSTLPLASASYAGLLSNTAFTHLSNFNIYEHSVPTTTSVRLLFTKPLTGETGIVTLAAATSARAGVMTAADKTLLDTLGKTSKHLGTFSNRADALAAASTFAIVSDSSLCLLTAAVAVSSSALNAVLILQQVQKNNDGGGQTIQYIHADKKCYTRYISFSATALTEVQPIQFDGARNLSLSGRVLQMTNMWGDNVGSSATLPDNGNLYEGTAGTDSVPLVLAKTFGGTATATLAAATSARAGVLTAALYNELKNATANIAAHYEEIQNHLNAIYARLSVIENKIEAYHPTSTQP